MLKKKYHDNQKLRYYETKYVYKSIKYLPLIW